MTDKKRKERCGLVVKHPLKPRLQCVANTPGDNSFNCDDLLDVQGLSSRRLVQCSLADCVGRDMAVERSICEKVSFTQSRLHKMTIRDARFQECDMANASWGGSFWDRVEIAGCRLVGFDASQAIMKNMLVEECQADFACFRFASFKKTVCFERCSLPSRSSKAGRVAGTPGASVQHHVNLRTSSTVVSPRRSFLMAISRSDNQPVAFAASTIAMASLVMIAFFTASLDSRSENTPTRPL